MSQETLCSIISSLTLSLSFNILQTKTYGQTLECKTNVDFKQYQTDQPSVWLLITVCDMYWLDCPLIPMETRKFCLSAGRGNLLKGGEGMGSVEKQL